MVVASRNLPIAMLRQSKLTPPISRSHKASALSTNFILPIRAVTSVRPSGTAPMGWITKIVRNREAYRATATRIPIKIMMIDLVADLPLTDVFSTDQQAPAC